MKIIEMLMDFWKIKSDDGLTNFERCFVNLNEGLQGSGQLDYSICLELGKSLLADEYIRFCDPFGVVIDISLVELRLFRMSNIDYVLQLELYIDQHEADSGNFISSTYRTSVVYDTPACIVSKIISML